MRLVSFSPFKTAVAALENQNSISEGIIPDDLKTFLAPQLVKGFVLGVLDPKLGSAISETFPKVKVKIGNLICEISRGLRTHFHKMVKLLSSEAGKNKNAFVGDNYYDRFIFIIVNVIFLYFVRRWQGTARFRSLLFKVQSQV